MPGSEGCPWDRMEFVDHEQVQDALFNSEDNRGVRYVPLPSSETSLLRPPDAF